jgi:hypothetical protein
MKNRAKLGIVLANGWTIKALLYTGVIDLLQKDFDLLCWVRPAAQDALQKEIDTGEIPPMKLRPMRQMNETRAGRSVRQLQKSMFAARHRLETEAIKRRSNYPKWQAAAADIIDIPARTPFGALALRTFHGLRRATSRRDWYQKDFEEFKPDGVVLGHPVDPYEWPISIEAKDRGIPVIATIQSWDNLSSKGVMGDFYSAVLVWNKTMQQEVFDYYPSYRPEQVPIVGVPRFQPCLAPLPAGYDRETFLRGLGLDPKKKIILFTTSASSSCPDQPTVAQHLLQAIQSGELADCQILIRRHPRDDSEISESENLKFWRQSVQNLDVYNWRPDRADNWIYAAMLRHAAVNLNPASTVSLEASICDLPVVNLAYDGDRQLPYEKSIIRYYDYSHQKPLLRFGATVMAKSRAEMIAQIREAIDHPEIRRAERFNLANHFCSLSIGDPIAATVNAIRNTVIPQRN